MKESVYYLDARISSTIMRLYFPSAQTRKLFAVAYPQFVIKCGRRPLIATTDDLTRTRMNIAHYPEIQSFLVIWDTFVK